MILWKRDWLAHGLCDNSREVGLSSLETDILRGDGIVVDLIYRTGETRSVEMSLSLDTVDIVEGNNGDELKSADQE